LNRAESIYYCAVNASTQIIFPELGAFLCVPNY